MSGVLFSFFLAQRREDIVVLTLWFRARARSSSIVNSSREAPSGIAGDGDRGAGYGDLGMKSTFWSAPGRQVNSQSSLMRLLVLLTFWTILEFERGNWQFPVWIITITVVHGSFHLSDLSNLWGETFLPCGLVASIDCNILQRMS